MLKVVLTDTFSKCLRKLQTAGKKGKDAIMRAKAAQADAATTGVITLTRTKHGESRLKNIEKYDLGDGYRLVVQVIQDDLKIFAFLFVGDHEDAERWLENHKKYQWVKSEKDNTLQFVQVSIENEIKTNYVEPNLDNAEELLQLPLLRKISTDDLFSIGIKELTYNYLTSITGNDWERDPQGIIDYIETNENTEIALLCIDLLTLAYKGEIDALNMRLKLELHQASLPDEAILTIAINDDINNETIVTWEEVNSLPENSSWSDWLLFLHPEQKKIARNDFNGPARLRGVSGSGKTCVMLHRARYLATKYKSPVLLITLTESMRKLLEVLIKDLCGVESSYIQSITVNSLGEKIINGLHPRGLAAFTKPNESANDSNESDAIRFVKNHIGYNISKLRDMNDVQLKKFIFEEYNYVMGRLPLSKLENYLDTKAFMRRGRGERLTKEGRQICYDAMKHIVDRLVQVHQLDYVCITQAANALLKGDQTTLNQLGWDSIDMEELKRNISDHFSPYRCILVDEVQDLSQLEVEMIANMPVNSSFTISNIEDGLFLVGDGAQTIYNKGFVLRECGVSVANRSYVLKKNYRNSFEIMKAAYALIESYEYADVDEDNIQKPTQPDYPNRLGEKPFIVKCLKQNDEVEFVSQKIKSLIEEYQQINETQKYPEICIIGLNKVIRNLIQSKLRGLGINCYELKENVGIDQESVSISTIESAKGHEFQYVFISNVISSLIPKDDYNETLSKEASRLYVAMTRAREKLFITYSVEGNNSPSPFLIHLQNESNEYEYKNGELIIVD